MQSKHINPFLESSIFVIEQMCQIKPSLGQLQLKKISLQEDVICLQINVFGDMEGKIYYSFPKHVALSLASGMMGGFILTELDEISRSAIAELGNMISGNASTILSNQGVAIDITPPKSIYPNEQGSLFTDKALSIPLHLDGVGELDIYVHFEPQPVSNQPEHH